MINPGLFQVKSEAKDAKILLFRNWPLDYIFTKIAVLFPADFFFSVNIFSL